MHVELGKPNSNIRKVIILDNKSQENANDNIKKNSLAAITLPAIPATFLVTMIEWGTFYSIIKSIDHDSIPRCNFLCKILNQQDLNGLSRA